MRTAVDTSALLAVFLGEPDAERWMDLLIRQREQGELVCCDIVWAELAPLFDSVDRQSSALADLGIGLLPVTASTAYRAGRLFAEYRRQGGPRQHLIPDFMVAAHAEIQASALMARDRGYVRRYFPKLTLLDV